MTATLSFFQLLIFGILFRQTDLRRWVQTFLIFLNLVILFVVTEQVGQGIHHPTLVTLAILFEFALNWALLYRTYSMEDFQFFRALIVNVLKMGAVVGGILFFLSLVFPKISFRLIPQSSSTGSIGYGSGTEMNPGEFSSLQTSDEISFHAKVNAPLPLHYDELPYWRGSSLSRTLNGLHWIKGKSDLLPLLPADVNPKFVPQVILLDGQFDRALFSLDFPVTAPTDTPVYETLSSMNTVKSELSQKNIQELLELPRGIDPELKKLSLQFSSDRPTLQVYTQRLLEFYSKNFKGDLDPGTYTHDELHEFFFKRKKGFCEHFSGSFSVLLRMAGFPSRVVTGFHGGEWNPSTLTWTVRNNSAHAWVEAWDFSNPSWVRIDPTLVVPSVMQNLPRPGWFEKKFDSLVTEWNFFRLNPKNQKKIFIGSWIVLFLVLLTIFILRISRKRNALHEAAALYAEYNSLLQKIGLHRKISEGPMDFLNRSLNQVPGEHSHFRSALIEFTQQYIHCHYGNGSLSSLNASLRDVKAHIYR